MRFFEARYGDVDRLVLDCQHARRFLSEKLIHEKWMIDQYDLTAPLHLETSRFHTKWAVPQTATSVCLIFGTSPFEPARDRAFSPFASDCAVKVPAADKESFHEFDDWVAATSCDGFLFLWPIIEGGQRFQGLSCRKPLARTFSRLLFFGGSVCR